MMSASNARPTAAAILAEILERPLGSVPDDASIHNFPAWDSLAHVKLMLKLEEMSGRPVDPGRIAMLIDLKAVDAYLQVI